jgi:hypothetical protein
MQALWVAVGVPPVQIVSGTPLVQLLVSNQSPETALLHDVSQVDVCRVASSPSVAPTAAACAPDLGKRVAACRVEADILVAWEARVAGPEKWWIPVPRDGSLATAARAVPEAETDATARLVAVRKMAITIGTMRLGAFEVILFLLWEIEMARCVCCRP